MAETSKYTISLSAPATLTATLGAGKINVNDYTLTVEEAENGVKLTLTRGSKTETVFIPNGAKGDKGEKGDKGDTGAKGEQGAKGENGTDGYSPTATVSKSGTTTTISITDKTGTTTATVEDGAKGDKGDTGDTGAKGDPGVQGPKGDPGSDASVTAENIQSALGYAPVKDVQVAGSSVLEGGVANVPTASETKEGVIKAPFAAFGLQLNNDNRPYVSAASEADITARQTFYRPLVPARIDYAVKAAMCDGKGEAWTAAEQKAARERMGVDKAYELIEEIILNESVTQVVRTNMSLAEMRIVVEVPVSDSTGAVTIEVYSGSGLIGYGYIGNFINKDNVKVAKFSVKRDRGAYVFSMVSTNANSASQKAGVSTLSETATLFQVENAITKISLYSTSSSILLPVGTKITIEGETI